MGGKGGGGGGGTQTVQQNADPWSGQQPYLHTLFSEADRLRALGGPQYFPGQTLAPPSPYTYAGINMMANRALGLGPGMAYTTGGMPPGWQQSSMGITSPWPQMPTNFADVKAGQPSSGQAALAAQFGPLPTGVAEQDRLRAMLGIDAIDPVTGAVIPPSTGGQGAQQPGQAAQPDMAGLIAQVLANPGQYAQYGVRAPGSEQVTTPGVATRGPAGPGAASNQWLAQYGPYIDPFMGPVVNTETGERGAPAAGTRILVPGGELRYLGQQVPSGSLAASDFEFIGGPTTSTRDIPGSSEADIRALIESNPAFAAALGMSPGGGAQPGGGIPPEAWMYAPGNPLINAADRLNIETMQGRYLDPSTNPWLEGTYNRAADQLENRFRTAWGGSDAMPGSGIQQGAMGDALATLGNQIYGQNYQQERKNQLAALGLAPATDAAGFANIAQLGAAGDASRGLTQQQINDAIQRYNYNQNLPYLNLENYGRLIQGQYGGSSTQTSTQPMYSSNLGRSLVGAGLGAGAAYGLGSIAGAPAWLAGPWGIGGAALLGALAGK